MLDLFLNMLSAGIQTNADIIGVASIMMLAVVFVSIAIVCLTD